MKKQTIMVLAVMMALSVFSMAADKWTGIVTDKNCATGANATNTACAKKCIDRDKAAVFVNDEDKSVTPIANVDAIKGHEGHHVTITGTKGDDGIHVDKVKMVEDKGK